ncbi:MAG TPA: translation elongation factor 4, partial [Candidatus Paceibacterota bacterium]
MKNIRNFSIIAHIDHGKSTLADRFLEETKTIEKRKMKDQVLDSMELERERGITIKMQPVRMLWKHGGNDYILNLIDTPGHIDFSYEVSRALTAVEGAILLVDATQGVQAQTLTTLRAAQEHGLVIIPVVSKIDSPLARIDDVKGEMSKLLGIDPSEIYGCSGRTGEGVEEVLKAVVEKVPPPAAPVGQAPISGTRSLIFDFQYSDHQGVIVFVRLMNGGIKKGDKLEFAASGRTFTALEVGVFAPQPKPIDQLDEGMIGYVVTGIKESGFARVGDTVRTALSRSQVLEGYAEPKPVVWASVYPESQDDFPKLRSALQRLRLSDAAFSFEEESSGVLGRGYRCGFLGMLHLEIIVERLKREHDLALVVTTPTITYEVELKNGSRSTVYSPAQFPEYGLIVKVWEPYVEARIVVPTDYVSPVLQLLYEHEGVAEATENFSEGRVIIRVVMPLRELMRNFFDKIKTVSSGYASVSYEPRDMREADVARLDIYVAEEPVPAFARIVAKGRAYDEAVAAVEKLHKILPRQMFATKIQGVALGRILSSKTLSALSKDVTGYLYGGDRTRKMKLWEKQKRGKKR